MSDEVSWLANTGLSKRLKNQGENEENQVVGESSQNFSSEDVSSNKSENDKAEVSTSMEVDKRGNFPTETSFKLLSDEKIEKASKDELVSLIERIKKELEIREKIEADSSSFQVRTHELKNNLAKAEN